ncbi:MAG: 2Fe-2S iron-sulfur cluster-binding protein [Terrimicrobiaceae bacterium]
MIRISYLPDARDVEASPAETILDAALRAGIKLTPACGRNARCSTCRVAIPDGLDNCTPRSEAEQAIADHLQFKPMIRLACQTQATGPMTVRRLVLDDEDEKLAVESMADSVVERASEERHVAILFADAVNFASRVEAANKTVASNFLMSEDAYHQVGNEVEVNQCPPWEIRGKTGMYQLYEVTGVKTHSD